MIYIIIQGDLNSSYLEGMTLQLFLVALFLVNSRVFLKVYLCVIVELNIIFNECANLQ